MQSTCRGPYWDASGGGSHRPLSRSSPLVKATRAALPNGALLAACLGPDGALAQRGGVGPGRPPTDTILAGGGNDTLCGGAGNDSINANSGNDHADGGSGNDTVHGDVGGDTLFGGTDVDSLLGDVGNDSLSGGSRSPDTCKGDTGTDTADRSCERISGVP
jgi:hemolysin type calcium-binding protein